RADAGPARHDAGAVASGGPVAASQPTPSPVSSSDAGPGAPGDPEAVRIASAGHSLKWNWTPPGHVDRYGHAETLIRAPLAAVRARVLDYQHYREILPSRFKISRVIGHVPDGSADVYIQIAVMHEMVLLWDVTRFAPVKRQAPDLEVVEGKMVPGKGNVEDLDVVWTMHALDPQWTVLKLDLLLKPNLPAPQSALDEELRDSALIAVDVIHDRAQGSPRVGPWPG
ncbi:MAG TPA: hypothetical protein VH044_19020, partial [Polyangiaceae bacterium]|nr:hypothetical protein [Polyangiaceae bacterium]